jgi:8-oxo-dGTP pyrophosphatase MutT (NUDIX family)
MTDLHDRLTRMYEAGHARSDIDVIANPWSQAEGHYRPSAVLAAITDRPDPGVLLLYRPKTMRSHAGEVVLPGGKVDPGETFIEAAVREAHEEMGIDPAAVRVIGPGDMLRTGTMYQINPVLALVPGDITITPNPAEVSDWFEAPLRHVLDPANHVEDPYVFGEKTVHVWTIHWNGHCIWGSTAMVLINLARRLNWTGARAG